MILFLKLKTVLCICIIYIREYFKESITTRNFVVLVSAFLQSVSVYMCCYFLQHTCHNSHFFELKSWDFQKIFSFSGEYYIFKTGCVLYFSITADTILAFSCLHLQLMYIKLFILFVGKGEIYVFFHFHWVGRIWTHFTSLYIGLPHDIITHRRCSSSKNSLMNN